MQIICTIGPWYKICLYITSNEEERDIDTLIKQGSCFVKVDLEYPKELHDLHNDYPLAPERKLVSSDMLSPYAKGLQAKFGIGDDSVAKLVPNLQNKYSYVADIRNAQTAVVCNQICYLEVL
jgi:hypothetical protein